MGLTPAIQILTGSGIVSDSSRRDICIAKPSNKGGKWKRILTLSLWAEVGGKFLSCL